jgi:hypothetical protein
VFEPVRHERGLIDVLSIAGAISHEERPALVVNTQLIERIETHAAARVAEHDALCELFFNVCLRKSD